MKEKKSLFLLLSLTFTLLGYGIGAVRLDAAELSQIKDEEIEESQDKESDETNDQAAGKIDQPKTSEAELSETRVQLPAIDLWVNLIREIKVDLTSRNETTESNYEGTVEADAVEIADAEAEVSDVQILESAEAGTELPSQELCVGQAKEIFEATNAERVAAGLPELVWSDELAAAADIRAEEVITYFSHIRPNGEKCYSLGSKIHSENIARGPHASGAEIVAHWMESPGHKANILRAEVFTAIGVGVRNTEMGDTAVQIFGTY